MARKTYIVRHPFVVAHPKTGRKQTFQPGRFYEDIDAAILKAHAGSFVLAELPDDTPIETTTATPGTKRRSTKKSTQ